MMIRACTLLFLEVFGIFIREKRILWNGYYQNQY